MPEEELVPVFSPPLAHMLALAERQKGSPITLEESLAVRDKAACVLLTPEKAQIMTERLGFRDVNPDNCYSDWNARLRAEITGSYLPKIILCVPATDENVNQFEEILKEEGLEYEIVDRDARLADSFRSADSPTQPSLTEQDIELISTHAKVVYFLSKNLSSKTATSAGYKFLGAGKRLLEAGAVAIKCESSGVAHSKRRWVELAGRAERGASSSGPPDVEFWLGLFLAYVQLPIRFGDDLYSCGMHLLGLPDLVATTADIKEAMSHSGSQASPIHEAIRLFDEFALYLLAECPESTFGTGHTFCVDEESPKFKVTWERCTDYEESDFFFNPFGRWRFQSYAK